ncbi:hypothetical protein J6590_009797, partial [Homalodisca vitripennis]
SQAGVSFDPELPSLGPRVAGGPSHLYHSTDTDIYFRPTLAVKFFVTQDGRLITWKNVTTKRAGFVLYGLMLVGLCRATTNNNVDV